MMHSKSTANHIAPFFRELVQEISQHSSQMLCHGKSGAPKPAPQNHQPESNHPSSTGANSSQALANLSSSPEAQDTKKNELRRKETFNLAMDAVFAKVGQAQAETDPARRGDRLVEAQPLMTEFLNMGRDPSLSESSRNAVGVTLKFYLQQVKSLAPNDVDLPWVQGAKGTPSQSYEQSENLVRNDPSLKSLYRHWEKRQAALSLRQSRELQEVQNFSANNTKH